MKYLSINRCKYHPLFLALMIEDHDGHGVRLTLAKCCGEWLTIQRWKLTGRIIGAINDEAEDET